MKKRVDNLKKTYSKSLLYKVEFFLKKRVDKARQICKQASIFSTCQIMSNAII